MKVNTDIYVAHEAFADTQNKYLIELALLAESYPFRDPMERSLTKEQESVEIIPLMANLKKRRALIFFS